MSAMDDLARMLKRSRSPGSDYTGVVTKVEGGTAYVQLTGSEITDTPAALSIDAKPGDRVRVRISNGRAQLTGNDTAPPTNDTKAIRQLQKDSDKHGQTINHMQKQVDETAGIAANTNQYFWVTEEGSDTGVHITEKPRKEFLADPDNGGGNLLGRSNGIAMRVGLKEMAQVSLKGFDVYTPGGILIGHIGYGPVTMSDGTTGDGPFYTLGFRHTGSNVGYLSCVIGTGEATAFRSIALNAGKANGQASVACGSGSQADSDDQVVIGRYCDPDANGNYVFIIGTGTDVNNLKNGVTVDWNGDLVTAATPKSGSLSTTLSGGSNYKNVCTKKGDMVNVAFHRANFTAWNMSGPFATLPAGYRPKVVQYVPGAVFANSTWLSTYFSISANGAVSIGYNPAGSGSTCTHIWFSGTFII